MPAMAYPSRLEELRPLAIATEAVSAFPSEELRLVNSWGSLADMSPVEYAVFLRNLATVAPSVALIVNMHVLAIQLFPQLADTGHRYSSLISGPATLGSDPRTVNKTGLIATQNSDSWELNGLKRFATGAHENHLLVTANEGSENGPVMVFHLPLDTSGVQVEYDWSPIGLRSTWSNSVRFTSAFVSNEQVLTRGISDLSELLMNNSWLAWGMYTSVIPGILARLVEMAKGDATLDLGLVNTWETLQLESERHFMDAVAEQSVPFLVQARLGLIDAVERVAYEFTRETSLKTISSAYSERQQMLAAAQLIGKMPPNQKACQGFLMSL